MIATRDMLPSDRRYVVPTWAKSSHYAVRLGDGRRLAMPLRERFALVDRILDAGARVVVLGSEAGAIHAWACGAPDLLHYVYVPPELRGHGLARRAVTALLGGYPSVIDVTHPWPAASARYRIHPHAGALRRSLRSKEAA